MGKRASKSRYRPQTTVKKKKETNKAEALLVTLR